MVGATAAGDFLDGPLTAQLSVKNLPLAPVAREFGIATVASVDADALASATVKLSGSARNPEADIALDATQATALGEKFERVRANLRYTAQVDRVHRRPSGSGRRQAALLRRLYAAGRRSP